MLNSSENRHRYEYGFKANRPSKDNLMLENV